MVKGSNETKWNYLSWLLSRGTHGRHDFEDWGHTIEAFFKRLLTTNKNENRK